MKIRRRKLLAGALSVPLVLLAAAWLLLPKPPLLEGFDFSRELFDRHHQLLRVTLTRDDKYRIYTPLAEVSPDLIRATLLQEDRYYLRHPGVNPLAIARSAWSLLRNGKASSGASTITMQLARLSGHIHSRTLSGKCSQIFRALEIERHYTKSQILEAYLNLAPYGHNIEGVGTASALYFRKPPAQLTMPEAVTLSVIPQSPTRRALYCNKDNPALTAAQNRLFLKIAPGFNATGFRARALGKPPFLAPHFTRQAEAEHKGSITTTLDGDLQQMLEHRIHDYLERNRAHGFVNAAAMLVDAPTMEVLADVGSANFFSTAIRGEIDGTRAKRSPGSTLKPFVYALAMDQGLIHPLSLVVDAPHSFAGYNPENFDHQFVGPVRASDALARSRNLPAITLASQLHGPGLYGLLKKAGVGLNHEESFYGLTLPLGGAEVTMQDLIRLYGALANDGRIRSLQLALPHPDDHGVRLVSPEASFLTLEMLETASNPLQGADRPGEPVFWKTGTSNGFHDAWAVAIFGQYVLAIWIGNFDGKSNPAFIGRTCAAPLLFQVVDALRSTGRVQWHPHLPPPGANLRQVEFCGVSGQLPCPFCKDRVRGWFIPGVTSIATCNVHREVLIDAQSGLRVATDDGTRVLTRQIYEFWPSNLLELFAKAGLPRRLPPPFLPGSSPESIAANAAKGKMLAIVSPKAGLVYAVGTNQDANGEMLLKADSDTDVARIFWFAGKQYLGASSRQVALRWHPSPGVYAVTALDDHGHSDSVTVKIQSSKGW